MDGPIARLTIDPQIKWFVDQTELNDYMKPNILKVCVIAEYLKLKPPIFNDPPLFIRTKFETQDRVVYPSPYLNNMLIWNKHMETACGHTVTVGGNVNLYVNKANSKQVFLDGYIHSDYHGDLNITTLKILKELKIEENKTYTDLDFLGLKIGKFSIVEQITNFRKELGC